MREREGEKEWAMGERERVGEGVWGELKGRRDRGMPLSESGALRRGSVFLGEAERNKLRRREPGVGCAHAPWFCHANVL